MRGSPPRLTTGPGRRGVDRTHPGSPALGTPARDGDLHRSNRITGRHGIGRKMKPIGHETRGEPLETAGVELSAEARRAARKVLFAASAPRRGVALGSTTARGQQCSGEPQTCRDRERADQQRLPLTRPLSTRRDRYRTPDTPSGGKNLLHLLGNRRSGLGRLLIVRLADVGRFIRGLRLHRARPLPRPSIQRNPIRLRYAILHLDRVEVPQFDWRNLRQVPAFRGRICADRSPSPVNGGRIDPAAPNWSASRGPIPLAVLREVQRGSISSLPAGRDSGSTDRRPRPGRGWHSAFNSYCPTSPEKTARLRSAARVHQPPSRCCIPGCCA